MTTTQLPERPNLEQLKNQAKDLLRASRGGDSAALARFRALPELSAKSPTELAVLRFALHDAQSVIAREHGFVSWQALRERVEELTLQRHEAADRLVRWLVVGRDDDAQPRRTLERVQRLLAQHPQLAAASFHAALVLGDVAAVEASLARAPALATQPGGPRGWEPLLYVAHSGWSAQNSDGLLATARLLLARGASPNAMRPWEHDANAKLPALWAALCVSRHLALGRLLLEAGANPNDGESVYHSAEHGDIAALELLAAHGAGSDGGAGAEPWDNTPLYFILGHYAGDPRDADVRRGAQWLLAHGADPNRVCYQKKSRETPLHAAARHWDGPMITLLLAHGADVHARRADGRTPLTLALLNGRSSAAEALVAAGAVEELTSEERFLAACFRGDRAEALRLRDPAFVATHADKLCEAVSLPTTAALETMLACGFDPAATGCMGETALHWAAFAGNAEATRLLLAHRAPVNVRDREHDADPLGWCDYAESEVGGGPRADFGGVARALIAAGATLPDPDHLDRLGGEAVKAAIAEFLRKRNP